MRVLAVLIFACVAAACAPVPRPAVAPPAAPGQAASAPADAASASGCPEPTDAQAFASDWRSRAEDADPAELRQQCAAPAGSSCAPAGVRAEALICLAVAELRGANMIGRVTPAGTMIGVYEGPGLEKALEYVERAVAADPTALAPRRELINVHLQSLGGEDELVAALGEALRYHHSAEQLQALWLPLVSELSERGDVETALAALKALEAHYADSSDVVANLGATLMMLDRDGEAFPYVERAVSMAPSDPVNVHNLGWWYARAGEPAKAAPYLEKAATLAPESEAKEYWCSYAAFLREQKQAARAARIESEHQCEGDAR